MPYTRAVDDLSQAIAWQSESPLGVGGRQPNHGRLPMFHRRFTEPFYVSRPFLAEYGD